MGVLRALFGLIAKPSSWPIIGGIMVACVLLAAAFYVNSLKAGNERLRAETAALEERVRERDETIRVIEEDAAAYRARTQSIMAELSKTQSRIAGNAVAAEDDYRRIVAPNSDVRILEEQANDGYGKIFRDLNTISR